MAPFPFRGRAIASSLGTFQTPIILRIKNKGNFRLFGYIYACSRGFNIRSNFGGQATQHFARLDNDLEVKLAAQPQTGNTEADLALNGD